MNRDYYVHLLRVWRTHGGTGRWTSATQVTTERPEPLGDQTIARYAVRCPTKGEAASIVLEWLARGRPRDMTVTEITP